ncbi:putative F5/8 type C domain-containing protein [Neospora caninum Liverpool]|nr:putative F5/8 type C domain-containing protein [Neospora caninum Liverpool]CBZ52212.1 putative F5/8 type C domain-containing protein [Neospora caninum Liverpool]|eukprot:XP_003882244.1 putative F5/8 type C domain-containing protein [Neospora caninum Liverpool]
MKWHLTRAVEIGFLLCLASKAIGCCGLEQGEAADAIDKTYIKIAAAEASSVYPSVGTNGMREYSPDQALTKGSGYWSSEGNHKNDVVSWTGILTNRRTVDGININWAYAPGKVSIAVSFDGKEPFQEVVPFQDVNAPSGTELQPNNQLKLLKGGSFCLSQEGSKAGMTNVAKDKQAKASHPRPGDTSHGPGFAIDGHSETYWASQNFPANAVPAAVFFDIDLGEKYKLNTAAIDWEYPAMSYSITISEDGKAFTPCTSNHVNSLYSTLDDLKSQVGRYVRLTLEKPHPVNGRIDNDLLYGIREFAIYSNRLRSIVQSCGVAKNSSDARDKYFLELVAEVDFTSGNELHNAGEAVARASAQVAQHETELEAAMPMLATCKADKEQAKEKLVSLEAKYGSLSDQLAALVINPSVILVKKSILSPAYGLEPIHLHSANQLASLHRMLKFIGVDLNNPVPLGISNGRGAFYSLDMKKDITGYVMGANAREAQDANTVGIGGEGLEFFDSSEVEMSAIICSTNQDALNPPPAYMDISCATPPGGNAAFDGPPGTSLTVKCPQNCLFSGAGIWKVGEAPVGGRGGRRILSQTAVVAPANPGIAAVGTYASVRNKRFFDGILSTDVYISGSGSVGIGFRMKDFENMFLFEMRQANGGFKRLLRIADGTPIEVARVDDGGYLEGKWYTVRIEMREARLRISVVEESTAPVVVEPEAIIDLIDGSFMSGSIGFFTSEVDGAYFDMVRVDALPCGIVGAVFKYMDPHNYMLFEMSPTFARLRKRADGLFTTAAKSFLGGYKIGEWNNITITFNGGTVVVNAGRGGSPIPIFSVIGREDTVNHVCLKKHCLPPKHPLQENRIVPNPFSSAVSVFTEVDTEGEAGVQTCLNRKHALER